jgi:hypothetical protein
VSVAIMAHPRRAAFVPELEAALDRPATVVWDDGSDSRWGTGRRALLAYDPDATHHLVIQDDAVIPRDLVAGVEAALAHTPGDVPLCLYVGKVRPYREMVTEYVHKAGGNTSWLVMDRLNWGVAVVLPVPMVAAVVAAGDAQSIPNYDSRMSTYFEDNHIPVWYPWPSLVDHRESPSLVPGRGHNGRVAHRFIGAGASALATDFTGQVLRLPDANDYRPGGSPNMLFFSEKYADLYIPTINVRFKDGYAETTTRGAVAYLQQPQMKRRGVRPATEDEAAAWYRNTGSGELNVAEPAAAAPPAGTVEVREPAPAEAPTNDAVELVEQPAGTADGDVPDGSAADVLAWVGDNVDRAKAAAAAEVEGKGRKTLLADLDRIIGE